MKISSSEKIKTSSQQRVMTAVRVRPLSQSELTSENHIITLHDSVDAEISCTLLDPLYFRTDQSKVDITAYGRKFIFDHVFFSIADHPFNSSQEDVYHKCGRPLVENAIDGYDCCLIAYGQTGSGKTYTMIGRNEESNDAHIGVIPRLCRDMFNEISERLQEAKNYLNTRDRDNVKVSKPNESMIHLDSQLSVSFFEIYNEKVYDLLSTAMNTPCRVREHPSNGAYVENLTLRSVTTYEDVLNVLEEGHRQRSTASTLMNAASSRSHAIFTLYLDQRVIDRANIPTESESLTSLQRKSKIHLIDLAGSERASSTGVSGQQLVEANNINKSLSTLGDVIKALSSPSKSSKESKHIPYRNSVLTWLLKESFSGNSRTTMLAAISPTDVSYQETLSTLKYIERVKNISTYSSRNDASIDTPQVLELKRKISELQAQLSASNSENILLKEELQQRNDMIDSLKSCSNCSEEIPTNITSILNSPMIRNDSFSISSFETSANVSSSTKDEIMSSDIRDIVCARDNQTDEKLSLTIESLDSKDIIHQQIFDNNNTDEETSTTTNYSPKSSKLMKSIKQIASTSYSIDAVREFVKQYEQRLFLAKEEKKYLVFSLQRTIIQLGEMLALQESAERDDILSYSIKRAVSILKALLQETMKGEILMQNNDEQLKHSIKNNIVTNVDTDSDEDLSLSSDNIMTTETHQNSNDFKESIYISKSQDESSLRSQHNNLIQAYNNMQMNYMRAIRLICDLRVDLTFAQNSLREKVLLLDQYRAEIQKEK